MKKKLRQKYTTKKRLCKLGGPYFRSLTLAFRCSATLPFSRCVQIGCGPPGGTARARCLRAHLVASRAGAGVTRPSSSSASPRPHLRRHCLVLVRHCLRRREVRSCSAGGGELVRHVRAPGYARRLFRYLDSRACRRPTAAGAATPPKSDIPPRYYLEVGCREVGGGGGMRGGESESATDPVRLGSGRGSDPPTGRGRNNAADLTAHGACVLQNDLSHLRTASR